MLQLMILSVGFTACSVSSAPSPISAFCTLVGKQDSMPPYGLVVPASLLSFFLGEYCWNEKIHVYTYDIFRERIGFKLLFVRHTSHVTRHTSHVNRHTSHVTRHTSHFYRDAFSFTRSSME